MVFFVKHQVNIQSSNFEPGVLRNIARRRVGEVLEQLRDLAMSSEPFQFVAMKSLRLGRSEPATARNNRPSIVGELSD